MSLDRSQEPSGLETEMWELLACRSLGVWERGDAQGAAKVNSLAAASIVLLSVVLQWGWQPRSDGSGLALVRGPSLCTGLGGSAHVCSRVHGPEPSPSCLAGLGSPSIET